MLWLLSVQTRRKSMFGSGCSLEECISEFMKEEVRTL